MLSPEHTRRLTQALCRTCCTAGITRAWEWRRGGQGVSFLRVRFGPSARHEPCEHWTHESLVAALDVVAQHYRVVAIDEAVAALKRERALPRSALVLVISLDSSPRQIDLAQALAHAKTPSVLYVAPGLLERGMLPWPVMIRLALEQVVGDAVEMYGRRWLLTGPEYRRAARDGITARLYALPEADRSARAEELVESWGVSFDAVPGLRWYEVESLARSDLITIGAAGLTGDSLVRLPLERAAYEMRQARVLLEEHVNARVRHFEYPWEDVSFPVREQVVRAGYASALGRDTGAIGMNRLGADPYALTACALTPGTPERIRMRLAGVGEVFRPLQRVLS